MTLPVPYCGPVVSVKVQPSPSFNTEFKRKREALIEHFDGNTTVADQILEYVRKPSMATGDRCMGYGKSFGYDE